MKNAERLRRARTGALFVIAALVASSIVIACTDDVPTSPAAKDNSPATLDRASVITALNCHASVTELTVTCAQAGSEGRAGTNADGQQQPANIIIGGQDVFVAVKSSNVNYDAGTGAFTFNTTIRNLIPQPLGTTDGVNPDPNGVRVFFASGPTVTSGSGLITVAGDGTATFTGANQPYYQYSQVLQQFGISSSKMWQLNMPPTVTTFDFLLLVSAEVPFPNGYIDLQVSTLRPPNDRQVTYTVRNANGTIDPNPGPIVWSTDDPNIATIDGSGVVNPLRAGSLTIVATAGTKVGTLNTSVTPIRRVWLGATNTDWFTGTNWYPDNIVPGPTDTAVVPDTTSTTTFPVLTANASIAGVEVDDITPGGVIPSIGLGAFNLTASGDVRTTNNASITNTSGVLFLTGIARTVFGTLPATRVTGTYSLIGNVTARATLRVDLGRLTNTSFRIQAASN